MEDLFLEKNKLTEVLQEYDDYLACLNQEYNNVYQLYHNVDEAENKKNYLNKRIKLVDQNILKPYFARIDFTNQEGIKDVCYLGKVGISNYDNKIITVDWRAPIATLYYDSNIGPTSYKVEDKYINGNLSLKRQYNIENKTLLSYNDVDTVSNDELLKPYLGVTADMRLKNIVATIQDEQNDIIRSSLFDNLIIQGVAGSGKTTVALHRIAYLVYNYRDIIKNNQYMVIGPNKFFINYISSVLPDLDVNDVKQFDLIEFTNNYLGENIKLVKGNTNFSLLKTSLSFKEIIDNYMDNYSKTIIDQDLMIKDFTLLSKDEINRVWQEVNKMNYDDLKRKIERCILLLACQIDLHREKYMLRINRYYDHKLELGNNLDTVRKERTNTINSFNKELSNLLNTYFKKRINKTSVIYKQMLSSIDDYHETNFYYEDLTPLLYLNYKIVGSRDYEQIRHVVIDEAQDYNELTFYALKKIMRKSTFSIYGDLAQSLFPERSLNSWECLNNVFSKINIMYLNKSYRTSIEIMHEANKINKYLNLKEAEAVIRHGDKVVYYQVNDYYFDLKKNLDSLINKKNNSIAIIAKDEEMVKKMYNRLKDEYLINIIDDNHQEYKGGICVITSRLSKGLEFDGVIITDSSDYKLDSVLDMKLLYVSMTRAMHNLVVMYQGRMLPILN